MIILFVAHNFLYGNGQGRINYEVVREAARQGHRVTLLADRVEASLLTKGSVRWERLRHRVRRPHLIGGFLAAAGADRYVRRKRNEYDVIVGAGYTLSERHDVNLCQFVHGAWLRSPVHVARLARGPWAWYQLAYTRFNSRWERHAYRAAGVTVAPSQKIRAELQATGVPADQIRVIFNGVDVDEFSPRTAPDADPVERVALGLPIESPLALFVGDIRTPRKNLDTVLRALVHLPSVFLAVVGALESSPFPAMARQLGISDRVVFTGFRSDVGRLMRAADLFVFPSRYEAGTLVLTEAAASGLPLVTARTAGGCEVFGPDVAEVIEDPDDLTACVRAIRRFADSPDARYLAARAARSQALQLTWSHMAQQYIRLFEEAANRRHAGGDVNGLAADPSPLGRMVEQP